MSDLKPVTDLPYFVYNYANFFNPAHVSSLGMDCDSDGVYCKLQMIGGAHFNSSTVLSYMDRNACGDYNAGEVETIKRFKEISDAVNKMLEEAEGE